MSLDHRGKRAVQGGGGHIARKRFGQNFLVDHGVIDEIVRAIAPQPGQHLIEIGPGLGALTNPLLRALRHADRDRARPRPGRPLRRDGRAERDRGRRAEGGLRCLAQEADQPLRIDRQPALQHLHAPSCSTCCRWAQVVDQHFMLQKEVVDRMVGAPGCKDYGRLSVMLQWRYRMESVLDVPPGVLRPAAEGGLGGGAHERRKILRHTLGAWMTQHGIEMDFDLQRRAEEVPVAEYLALAALKRATPPQD
jgi:16S rRNA (adenine1518-N6/adenine1519-N6)-dimethyltransferase